jgi:GT2 family glycosyltransferase
MISLVICTRNRADRLADFFFGLSQIKYPDWELILVDNNSDDATWEKIGEFISTLDMRAVRIKEFAIGSSNAKNAGVKASAGAILVFTDDDCYPSRDWLLEIAKSFEDEQVGFVGGKVILHDPLDAPITIQLRDDEKLFRAFSYVYPGEIHGANMAIRREAFDQIKGFDPLLGAGRTLCAEDVDALNRVAAAGWKGRYVPTAVVSHHHRRKVKDAHKLKADYAMGRGALLVKVILAGSLRQKASALKAFFGSILRQPILAKWEIEGAITYIRQSGSVT